MKYATKAPNTKISREQVLNATKIYRKNILSIRQISRWGQEKEQASMSGIKSVNIATLLTAKTKFYQTNKTQCNTEIHTDNAPGHVPNSASGKYLLDRL